MDANPVWELCIARYPKCNPQSAPSPTVLQSASLRNLQCRICKIASGVRSMNCAGPRTTSKLVTRAPERC
eukprot:15055417-Alexandrium_andersonii.AAC.1